MTAEVVRVEANVPDRYLCLVRVLRRVGLGELVRLQHVEHRRLACVVEAEEDDVGALLEESEPLQAGLEEVVNRLHDDQFCGVLVVKFIIKN